MNRSLPCFKAYAIRGRLRDEFNEDLAFRVGLAFAKRYRPDCVAVGHDVRHSSPVLLNALANGLALHGVKVLHLGLCATEEMYWAAQQPGIDGGFMVTGGHHPAHHNGIKLLLSDAVPLNRNNGWHELEQFTADSEILAPLQRATTQASGFRDSHLRFLQRYLPRQPTRRITIVVNPGNGCGAPLLDALESSLPFKLVKMNHRPDGSFPNGIADPLLPEMRAATGEAVRGHHADFGVAWDIDMDRCILFDEFGRAVDSYYLIGLLSQMLLQQAPGNPVVHDAPLVWNTREQIEAHGGIAVASDGGHSDMIDSMCRHDAIYGGTRNGHHYFRDFAYCDSGMLPWLLMARLIASGATPLSHRIAPFVRRYPCSTEVTRPIGDLRNLGDTLDRIAAFYRDGRIERCDGLSVEFPAWRFHLRGSAFDALLHINVEARDDARLLHTMAGALLNHIDTL